MKLSKLDLFSSEFYFNLEGQRQKKGTFQGVILTLLSTFVILSYFIYLCNQYLNNQIDPQFRSQSFITNIRREIPLNEDFIGFNFYYNTSLTLSQFQAQQNKTYLVFIPFLYYQDKSNNVFQQINLNTTQCNNPQLEGQNCIDMSQISNYTFLYDQSNSIFSQIFVNMYGCLDLDDLKTTIPDNCASQSEIDEVINGGQAGFSMFLKAQQYNTTSKQIQTRYRFVEIFGLSNQFILSQLKTQIQNTEVKQGLIFQEQQTYSTPVSYDQTIQSFDRQLSLQSGLGPYIQINIKMDEIMQFTQIQYPTITQILALANSIGFIAIICRFIARFISQNVIKEDFFILIMRNLFQDKCQQVLQHNNLINKCEIVLQIHKMEEPIADSILEQQNNTNLVVPNFQIQYLQKKNIAKSQQNINTNFCDRLDSINSLQNQQNQTNKIKFDKIDFISQKESLKASMINSKATLKIKEKENTIIQKSLNKQQEISKNAFKTKFQNQKIKKSFVDAISKRLKIIDNNSMKQVLQNTIFKFRCCKNKEYLLQKGIDQKQMIKIQKEVLKNLNINELFKDIIFLKKAISMLLSLDQIAAIQLIGLTDNYMTLDLESTTSNINFYQNLNHFEQYYVMQQCGQIQIDYIQKFLTKCEENDEVSIIDQRIISSISNNI
ncbi:AMP-binding enzyme family protein (macronuclear) [Tetrahymena thermophila SB210]|uniref:AMP-binding enzyme family protein n=1 Tax=Tetrahymena thermophila (strain SB210) TaxID=312017 RepID=Q22EA2_TETTS|nr:AMP-binding enzyme family protein [Tetrahymena thermophila SB210]EAR83626.2 AMP-binding enzyme family protein [Tetrahymena thermophila SB210]|eukprot:XP_001031289.2 AMP-binding enzyme family protein [Tetrahymena thermophila SB210]